MGNSRKVSKRRQENTHENQALQSETTKLHGLFQRGMPSNYFFVESVLCSSFRTATAIWQNIPHLSVK